MHLANVVASLTAANFLGVGDAKIVMIFQDGPLIQIGPRIERLRLWSEFESSFPFPKHIPSNLSI